MKSIAHSLTRVYSKPEDKTVGAWLLGNRVSRINFLVALPLALALVLFWRVAICYIILMC